MDVGYPLVRCHYTAVLVVPSGKLHVVEHDPDVTGVELLDSRESGKEVRLMNRAADQWRHLCAPYLGGGR